MAFFTYKGFCVVRRICFRIRCSAGRSRSGTTTWNDRRERLKAVCPFSGTRAMLQPECIDLRGHWCGIFKVVDNRAQACEGREEDVQELEATERRGRGRRGVAQSESLGYTSVFPSMDSAARLVRHLRGHPCASSSLTSTTKDHGRRDSL